MAQRDGKNGKVVVHLGALALSGVTPASTAWLDTRGFDKATLVLVNGVITDAGTVDGISFVVEESNTTAAADATAVVDDQLTDLEATLTVTADAADNVIGGGIGYLGSKRYVRITATGTTLTDASISVIGILEAGSYEPQTFVGASVAAT